MPGHDQDFSKKKKFVKDGIFYAELNEFLTKELAEDGYAGVEVRVTPTKTEIIIRATRTQNVLGEKGRRIRELTSLVQKRFNFQPESVELFAEKVANRALCAVAQAESLRYKLLGGLAVRRACYGVLRFIMENGAKGCEVVISGKLRGQRAKAMKFKDGYMICSGDAVNHYIDQAVRHVMLRQGVLGIKVKIMLDYDPQGKQGPSKQLPDIVRVIDPKPRPVVPDAPGANLAPQFEQQAAAAPPQEYNQAAPLQQEPPQQQYQAAPTPGGPAQTPGGPQGDAFGAPAQQPMGGYGQTPY